MVCIRGVLAVQLRDRTYIISRGGVVFIPKLTVRAFSNNGDAIVKVLVVDTRGGFNGKRTFCYLPAAIHGNIALWAHLIVFWSI